MIASNPITKRANKQLNICIMNSVLDWLQAVEMACRVRSDDCTCTPSGGQYRPYTDGS